MHTLSFKQQTNTHTHKQKHLSIYLTVHLSIYQSIHPCIHPSIYSFIHSSLPPYIQFIHTYYIHPSIHPIIHSYIHTYSHPSIHPSKSSLLLVYSPSCLCFIHAQCFHPFMAGGWTLWPGSTAIDVCRSSVSPGSSSSHTKHRDGPVCGGQRGRQSTACHTSAPGPLLENCTALLARWPCFDLAYCIHNNEQQHGHFSGKAWPLCCWGPHHISFLVSFVFGVGFKLCQPTVG